MKTIHILLPVYNEERRLESGLNRLIPFMEEHFKGRYLLTVVDNGSTDKTGAIAGSFAAKYSTLHYMRIPEKGLGVAFRSGCAVNKEDIVGYMDIDLATDIKGLLDTKSIFDADSTVDIVSASRYAKGAKVIGRKWYRSITSYGWMFILKLSFGVKFTDSIAGFIFLKKAVADELIAGSSDDAGWFYLIELLIRAERKSCIIKEIPAIWTDDPDTKVKLFKVIGNYLRSIAKLKATFRKEARRTAV